jgi:hypothetical protein
MRGVPEVIYATALACVLGCGSEAPVETAATVSHAKTVSVAESARADSSSCSARPGREVKFSRDVEPILMSGCSGEYCHGLAMMSASRAYAFFVDQPSFECDGMRRLVTPGDPDHSYVMDKVLGRNLCSGHVMPRGLENRLSTDEVRTLTDWICEGARND